MAAWHAAHLMNMWRGKNSPAITHQKLLSGHPLFADEIGLTFRTKEEMDQYKAEMREVGKMHGRWLKAIQEGKLKTRPVNKEELKQLEIRLKRKRQDN